MLQPSHNRSYLEKVSYTFGLCVLHSFLKLNFLFELRNFDAINYMMNEFKHDQTHKFEIYSIFAQSVVLLSDKFYGFFFERGWGSSVGPDVYRVLASLGIPPINLCDGHYSRYEVWGDATRALPRLFVATPIESPFLHWGIPFS